MHPAPVQYHYKTVDSHLCFPLQVDYESEEEDGVDDAEDKEDQGEEEEEENVEKSSQEESPPESAAGRLESKRKRVKRGGGEGDESLTQMRINSVLESNPAIERYCYDHQRELWCEVSSSVLPKQTKANLDETS